MKNVTIARADQEGFRLQKNKAITPADHGLTLEFLNYSSGGGCFAIFNAQGGMRMNEKLFILDEEDREKIIKALKGEA